MNKSFFFLVCFLILSNCGYEPIYSTKNLNFTIGKIDKSNTSLNNKFSKKIDILKNKKIEKKIDIKIESNKEINIKSKDTKGNTLVFELKITLKVSNLNLNNNEVQSFSRKITYNNSDDKFKLKKYENELENILINKVVEDLIVYLTNIE
tara:strand:- start:620 stop:1069 length:450 start_codon:yes stop_codon:yes gene_type:complete